MLVGVFDEVEDLHDRRVGHLGEELPLGHRDRLRLGVAGVHQALEHDRSFVDVVVDGQVHPAQSAVRDAALDLVLVGHHVARTQLRQEGVGAAAVRAPALGGRLVLVGRRPADGLAAVPAEPLRLGDNGIDHQRGERVDLGNPRDLHQPAAEPPGRRERRAPPSLVCVLRFGCRRCRRSPRRRRNAAGRSPGWPSAASSTPNPCRGRRSSPAGCRRRLRADPAVSISPDTSVSEAPAPGRAPSTTCGTGCSTCRRARIRSRVPLTKRTSPVFSRLMPMPYGSSAMFGPMMCRYGSCATRPARIESSVLTASTSRCCKRHQAVRPGHHRHDDRRRRDLLDPLERRGAASHAHPLARTDPRPARSTTPAGPESVGRQ